MFCYCMYHKALLKYFFHVVLDQIFIFICILQFIFLENTHVVLYCDLNNYEKHIPLVQLKTLNLLRLAHILSPVALK